MYYNGKKVRNLYYNGKYITRLALGKEMTRLVEGDDFVRAEWLCGRNGAYINTNYYPVVGTDIFSVHFRYDGTLRNPDGGEQDAFGVNYTISDKNNFIRSFVNSSNYLSCSYYEYAGSWPTTGEYSKEWDIANLMIDGSDFKYVANRTDYSFANNGIQQQTSPFSLFVFKNNDNVYNQNCYLHGDISSFKITDTSSNTKMHLIPCRLLCPIPASLDGNGIARNADECGMYNLVNGLFYGNVASSGSFTVSDN